MKKIIIESVKRSRDLKRKLQVIYQDMDELKTAMHETMEYIYQTEQELDVIQGLQEDLYENIKTEPSPPKLLHTTANVTAQQLIELQKALRDNQNLQTILTYQQVEQKDKEHYTISLHHLYKNERDIVRLFSSLNIS